MVGHIFHIIAAARCDEVAVQCRIHNVLLTYLLVLHLCLSWLQHGQQISWAALFIFTKQLILREGED